MASNMTTARMVKRRPSKLTDHRKNDDQYGSDEGIPGRSLFSQGTCFKANEKSSIFRILSVLKFYLLKEAVSTLRAR